MLPMTRKCTSLGLSFSVSRLQTTAPPGGGGSGTGCWRPDEGLCPVVLMPEERAFLQAKAPTAFLSNALIFGEMY